MNILLGQRRAKIMTIDIQQTIRSLKKANKLNDKAIFTIASINYIAYARTLFDSIRTLHSDEVDLYLLLVDEVDGKIDINNETFAIIEAKDIEIIDFKKMAYKYAIMELSTAVKPFFIKQLLENGYNKILYLDPDILVLDRLDLVFDLLDSYSIILTPHITSPINDAFRPSEQDFLKNGIYNLGFIALSNTTDSIKLSEWWCSKCEVECYNEPETGYFVDQKWINYVPGLFESVYILRHKGFNMAYWNLHERYLNENIVNTDEKLYFYHFSGINFEDLKSISIYQNRYTLEQRTDLIELFELYKNKMIQNGFYETMNWPYKYSSYENGEKIGPVARRLYDQFSSKYPAPFSVQKTSYYNLLKSKGLLENCSYSNTQVDRLMRKGGEINFFLKILKKIVGINRYDLLMRYLHWISVIRRQKFLLE